MNNDYTLTDSELLEEQEIEIPKPTKKVTKKQSSSTKVVAIEEELIVDEEIAVLFTKRVHCDGKLRNIHDIASVKKSELDKLPPKSYLVRKIK